MTVTYPADLAKPYGDRVEAQQIGAAHEEPFVPVYARRGKARGGQGKVRTWMILAPVAVLTLGGIGAMLVLSGDNQASAPLAEPAATAPVLSAMPVPTEAAAAPLASAATPEPVVAPPAAREAAPAPARRPAVRTPAPAPEVSPRVEAPVAPTGPRPYTAAPDTAPTTTLNTAPAAPAVPATPAPPPPVIVIEPAG